MRDRDRAPTPSAWPFSVSAALCALIAVVALGGCATRPQAMPPPANAADQKGSHWIALPHEAPTGQLVTWTRGPFVFVMRYADVLTSLDTALGDSKWHAPIRSALLTYENDPDAAVLPLNDVIGKSPDLDAAFAVVLANLLEERRASLIDTERGFVIGSVQEVTASGVESRGRLFQTRDGREVLRTTEVSWAFPLSL